MGMTQQVITEEVCAKALAHLKNITKENRIAIRLRAIVAAKEHGIGNVAGVFDVNANTIRLWAKNFHSGGIENLEYKAGRGRKSNLSEKEYELLSGWIKKDCNLTIAKIVKKFKDECGIKTSNTAVHGALKKLNFSHITPRPQHHKQNQESHSDFKKN